MRGFARIIGLMCLGSIAACIPDSGHGYCYRREPTAADAVVGTIGFIAGIAALTAANEPPPPPPPRRVVVRVQQPEPPGPTVGWVMTADGTPLTGALVQIQHESGFRLLTKSDAEGAFHSKNPLPSGRYGIRLSEERWEGAIEAELPAAATEPIIIRATRSDNDEAPAH